MSLLIKRNLSRESTGFFQKILTIGLWSGEVHLDGMCLCTKDLSIFSAILRSKERLSFMKWHVLRMMWSRSKNRRIIYIWSTMRIQHFQSCFFRNLKNAKLRNMFSSIQQTGLCLRQRLKSICSRDIKSFMSILKTWIRILREQTNFPWT